MTVYIKDWLFNKIRDDVKYGYLTEAKGIVVRETEKAYLISFEAETSDGEHEFLVEKWCPKSCTMDEAEYKQECAREVERMNAAYARYEEGCKKYEALVKFAKDNGVKGVRTGLRAVTILAKIQAAGLEYAY